MSMASMEKHLFNLKFAAKELERCSKKCDKEEKAEKLKLKKAIEKGNTEVFVLCEKEENLWKYNCEILRLLEYMQRMPFVRRTNH